MAQNTEEPTQAAEAAEQTVEVRYKGEFAGDDWFGRGVGQGADDTDLSAYYQFDKTNKFALQMPAEDARKLREHAIGKDFAFKGLED